MREQFANGAAVAILLIALVLAWGGPLLNALADAIGAP